MNIVNKLLLDLLQNHPILFATEEDPVEVLYYAELGANEPFKKHASDAGFDLSLNIPEGSLTLLPGKPLMVSTGIRFKFPKNTWWMLDTRSSTGKKGVDVCCRTIDGNYLGVVHIMLCNVSSEPVTFRHGERVAQIIPAPFTSHVKMKRAQSIEELGSSDRGENGFGSTGR